MPEGELYCQVCGEDAVVGVGSEPMWVCLTHFNEWLGERSRLIKELRESASA